MQTCWDKLPTLLELGKLLIFSEPELTSALTPAEAELLRTVTRLSGSFSLGMEEEKVTFNEKKCQLNIKKCINFTFHISFAGLLTDVRGDPRHAIRKSSISSRKSRV